jgi:valyl-tRNA synthetase
VFVVTGHVHKQKLIRQQLEVCKSLIKGCDSLTVVEEVPEGCALSTAVSETSVYLLVKGQVDLSLELEKYRQKLEKMVIIADGLEQKMGVEEYKKQVKLEVIQIDVEKLNGYKNEIAAIQKSIGQFEKFL